MQLSRSLRLSLTGQILIALGVGVILGLLFGPNVSSLGLLGTLVIQLIKVFAIPFVFIVIVEALLTTSIGAKSAGKLLLIVAINSTMAITIGLLISNTLQPGRYLRDIGKTLRSATTVTPENPGGKQVDLMTLVSGYIPESVAKPFLENNTLGVVILALLFGLALRRVLVEQVEGQEKLRNQAERLVQALSKTFAKMLGWLVALVPLAVLGVTAKTVGEHGLSPLQGLGVYLGAGIGGLVLQCIIVYQFWIFITKRVSLPLFWNAARRLIVYAFGTNSSLATLPLTLEELDKLGISRASSRLGACVGTNLNNDGIILYEAMAVLLVAQAHGIMLSLPEQVMTSGLCVVAAIGISGIPEAGVISLSLVLSAAGIPLDLLPLLLTVDWLIARMRSVTNVLADLTVSIVLDASAGQNSI